MKKISKPSLNAVTFSYVLCTLLVVMALLMGAGFYWGSKALEKQALTADHARIDAELSAEDIAQLKRLEAELESKKDIVSRAEQIVAESKQYKYQDQIVRDINSFANSTGVDVLGYNFSTDSSQSSASVGPTVAGVKAITANITLDTPLPYANFLRFLKAVEQNLTKMQVTGVNMTPTPHNPDTIGNPTIGLIIYVRND